MAMTVAGPDLFTARSASPATIVATRLAAAEPLLFAGVGSLVGEVAMATLTSVPVAGAVTVTERVTLAPFARVATVGQVTTPAACVPPLSADTNPTPAGSVSRTTTLRAEERRVGKTTIAQVIEPFASTPAGPDLATARPACAVTV